MTRARLSGVFTAVCAYLALSAICLSSTKAETIGMSAEGTEFVLRTDKGQTLRSSDLVGRSITIETSTGPRDVTITAVDRGEDVLGNLIWLHTFVTADETGKPIAACKPDANGEERGFPYPTENGFDLACTSGAAGKCILWGYRPWDETSDSRPMTELFHACIRMVRADYGGDGQSMTRDGTPIRFCDRYNIHACRDDANWQFEAAWTSAGAECVARVRVPTLADLSGLAARYSSLAGRTGPDACRLNAHAAESGAILYSFIQP